MSSDELDILRQSIGEFISINSFFSTSLDRHRALTFLLDNTCVETSSDGGLERVLFEIDADPRVVTTTTTPFASIASLSDVPTESEVLFMLGSIFRLDKIRRRQPGDDDDGRVLTIIKMTLCGDEEHDLQPLYDHMRKETGNGEVNLLSLGQVLRKMGKFDLSEKYYRRMLDELPSNDPSLGDLCHSLGLVANAKGEYDMSLEWYHKSLAMLMRTRPSDHFSIGNTHNSIGVVHEKKGDHSRALESYNKAVSLFEQAHDENHPHMASFYNNIGAVYQHQAKYSDALVFYEKSLGIQQKHLPPDHPALGTSYNNIGSVHYSLGQYDLALEHYNRSLAISLKSLPPQHPDIAMTYENMGYVYADKGELERALTYLQKASAIYHHSLPSQHPLVREIDQAIERVSKRLHRK